jgi:hypothetical protein
MRGPNSLLNFKQAGYAVKKYCCWSEHHDGHGYAKQPIVLPLHSVVRLWLDSW